MHAPDSGLLRYCRGKKAGYASATLAVLAIIAPLLAVVAFVLARRNDRMGLATSFLSFGPLTHVISVIGFAIGVAMRGF